MIFSFGSGAGVPVEFMSSYTVDGKLYLPQRVIGGSKIWGWQAEDGTLLPESKWPKAIAPAPVDLDDLARAQVCPPVCGSFPGTVPVPPIVIVPGPLPTVVGPADHQDPTIFGLPRGPALIGGALLLLLLLKR